MLCQTRFLALALLVGSASSSFVVTEGACLVTGDCVLSPNYPAAYDDYVECTFSPASTGWIDVAGFDLHGSSWSDYCYDHLTVDDGVTSTTYCNDQGPQGAYVTPSTTMTFIADYYTGGHGGFMLCLSSTFTSTLPPPTPTPTIGACDTADTGHFSIVEGNCTVCGNCFYSPNHIAGGNYDHNHDCVITPLQSGYLDVQSFSIESSYWWGCV